ncbi:photosystem I assembly protein ycf4 [Gossypium australe]|uniref:Photosystem I assembly protein Ycf4 n=1 Tax=Gossypium australe TaxID=47621 RepID=A0A5B6WJG7_9ROSI|nr:photosystem I assembly protein ycf4 [Gossypium australe]
MYELAIRIYMDRIFIGNLKNKQFLLGIYPFSGSLGFLLEFDIFISVSQEIVFFFQQGIVMSFYRITDLFISSYLWCTIFWNVGSNYDQFDKKEGIVCIFC